MDIGAFGSAMGVAILVFAATLFSFLADRYGPVKSVSWALFFLAIIYALHPLAGRCRFTPSFRS